MNVSYIINFYHSSSGSLCVCMNAYITHDEGVKMCIRLGTEMFEAFMLSYIEYVSHIKL